jgi:hydrogenase maturation protease
MAPMQQKKYMIIGVGNVLRQDDGAGLLLAEAVRSALDERGKATHIRQVQQLMPELAEEINEIDPHTLLIADCRADADNSDGQVSRLQAADSADGSGVLSSHGLTPAQLLTVTAQLYGYDGEVWLATVPGVEFGHGEGLSLITRQAIERLIPELIERIL